MKTKTVKSKIVYPHLGIVEEVEEEIFTEVVEDTYEELPNNQNNNSIERLNYENIRRQNLILSVGC